MDRPEDIDSRGRDKRDPSAAGTTGVPPVEGPWWRRFLSHDSGPFAQFVKYGAVGVASTLAQMLVFYLLASTCCRCLGSDDMAVKWLGLPAVDVSDWVRSLRFAVDTVIGFSVANVFCWLMNRVFVFRPGKFAWYKEFALFFSAAAGGLLRHAGNEGGNHDVLDGGELRQQLVELEHEADVAVAEVGQPFLRQRGDIGLVDDHRTAVGTVQCADDLQQGGLASSTGAYDADHLAFVDVQVDAFQYL